MKKKILIIAISAISAGILPAADSLKDDIKKVKDSQKKNAEKPADVLKKHSNESVKAAITQDELSADVQDLIQEQTSPKVLKLLNEAEDLMGEATEKLENKKTGSETLAIETEIIEKIFAAAKAKSQ